MKPEGEPLFFNDQIIEFGPPRPVRSRFIVALASVRDVPQSATAIPGPSPIDPSRPPWMPGWEWMVPRSPRSSKKLELDSFNAGTVAPAPIKIQIES